MGISNLLVLLSRAFSFLLTEESAVVDTGAKWTTSDWLTLGSIIVSAVLSVFTIILAKKANDNAEAANKSAEAANTLAETANKNAVDATKVAESANKIAEASNELAKEANKNAIKQMELSNRQHLFDRRLKLYAFIKAIFVQFKYFQDGTFSCQGNKETFNSDVAFKFLVALTNGTEDICGIFKELSISHKDRGNSDIIADKVEGCYMMLLNAESELDFIFYNIDKIILHSCRALLCDYKIVLRCIVCYLVDEQVKHVDYIYSAIQALTSTLNKIKVKICMRNSKE